VERALGLMCGAGVLPALMAAEARRQGWRVVAFAFDDPAPVAVHAARVVPSRLSELGPVLALLAEEKVTGVLFSGRFRLDDVLRSDAADAAHARMAGQAGALVDTRLTAVAVSTLSAMGIELLDQRPFLGDSLAGAGCWTPREPTAGEWEDVRRGVSVARLVADASVGQTVVVKRGAVSAVEAVEGTTETIRRGTALGGPGAVVVKVAAAAQDFRFDTPTIGVETIDAAAAGRAAVVAVEAGRVLVLDPEATVRRATAAGIALLGVDAAAP
jgi:UDP-2,3-diacylglucosamine hydrolase